LQETDLAEPVTPGQDLIVLIGASAPGGSNLFSENWTLVISCAAQRISASEVVERDMRLELPVAEEELKELMSRLQPYQVIEVVVANVVNESRLILSGIKAFDVDDRDLAKIAASLQKPVVITHEILGELTLDRRFGSYSGRFKWLKNDVNISLDCASPDKPESTMEHALTLLSNQSEWQSRVEDCALRELLDLKNASWREDGEPELAGKDFLARISLETIWISHDGSFTFWFNDGDLFWGHAIEVRGTLEVGPTSANIAG
jgi:hypothetical protein